MFVRFILWQNRCIRVGNQNRGLINKLKRYYQLNKAKPSCHMHAWVFGYVLMRSVEFISADSRLHFTAAWVTFSCILGKDYESLIQN